jgi:hypothetical protein
MGFDSLLCCLEPHHVTLDRLILVAPVSDRAAAVEELGQAGVDAVLATARQLDPSDFVNPTPGYEGAAVSASRVLAQLHGPVVPPCAIEDMFTTRDATSAAVALNAACVRECGCQTSVIWMQDEEYVATDNPLQMKPEEIAGHLGGTPITVSGTHSGLGSEQEVSNAILGIL